MKKKSVKEKGRLWRYEDEKNIKGEQIKGQKETEENYFT